MLQNKYLRAKIGLQITPSCLHGKSVHLCRAPRREVVRHAYRMFFSQTKDTFERCARKRTLVQVSCAEVTREGYRGKVHRPQQDHRSWTWTSGFEVNDVTSVHPSWLIIFSRLRLLRSCSQRIYEHNLTLRFSKYPGA